MATDPRGYDPVVMVGPTHSAASVTASHAALADIDECLRLLASSRDGLSSSEAAQRLLTDGPNQLPSGRRRDPLRMFLANFVHVLALLLWIASFLAFVGGLPELGWAIVAVVLINGVFSFVQEYRAERVLAALKERLAPVARVLRDGEALSVEARTLVVGDMVLLSEGDRVPADARLIVASEVEVDESSLTGESLPVSKRAEGAGNDASALSNVVYAGTLVVRGDAQALVFATGGQTQFGGISAMTAEVAQAAGPLEREIDVLSRTTAVVAIVSGLVVWGLGTVVLGREVSEGFIFAVGVIVALVPEGLLPTLSMSLAIGVQRMARRNVLVRRMASIEALGATQVICTDKTGTLTMNEMTVTRLWLPHAEYAVSGSGYEPHGEAALLEGEPNSEGLSALLTAASLASNAGLTRDADKWRVVGDPTEGAILVAAAKLGLRPEADRLRELAFDSSRRMMSTVNSDSGGGLVLSVKGAPDAVLAICARGPDAAGMSDSLRQDALSRAEAYAERGMRVLASARRTIPQEACSQAREALETDLQFLGLIAMQDPVRPEAVRAVDACHRAGIRVVIITGDHPGTAAAIARDVGIVPGRPHVVTGDEVDSMTPAALHAALHREAVFARATPAHKLAIVSALQDMGQVVAAVGDGVNDAPSLRRADVGVAMGKTGTDVAREAADIVLQDDNFATIVDAIEEGRAIFANIRKFVTYVFTSNVAELVPFAAFVLTGIPLPLKVLQILAVDLGTDLVPALGLGAEPPEPGVLDEPPRRRGAPVLDRRVFLRTFLLLGPVEALLGLAGYFFVYWTSGWRPGETLADSGDAYVRATTMTFASIVVGQIGCVFACRSYRVSLFRMGVGGNLLLTAGVAVEVLFLLLIGRVPPFTTTFEFLPLGWTEWLFLLAVLPALPVADELRKLRLRSHRVRASRVVRSRYRRFRSRNDQAD